MLDAASIPETNGNTLSRFSAKLVFNSESLVVRVKVSSFFSPSELSIDVYRYIEYIKILKALKNEFPISNVVYRLLQNKILSRKMHDTAELTIFHENKLSMKGARRRETFPFPLPPKVEK